ncbi:MFS transporter [Mycobacterium ulcerans]|uniref:MFS transporter n=1 Tax=Mycobacterium ulcerans TaxID=1809 RepID=UPI0012DC97FA|nr:MFS transporter [Mycobacterium ulcerans]MEB3968647.1 MFS transporter [Mycobacterium ulcerans]MEB3976821.1 MFS transporter [Mycobacterium ulcerans]MEB4006161.1 MFS transporter [Mycobacterium ulcerans]MEB4415671.1 MFS transporter [Mycobacterium ulcerans]MEB4433893.1 MFS transporter [Mycobacterium ulcerans]
MTETARETGSWRELLRGHLGTATLLAGGVAMYATNEFLTVSLLPSTIAEIGGSRLYAWVTTLYLVGSVVSATTVNAMLLKVGARMSYLMGLTVFGFASLVCAAAQNMEMLVAGRTLQGVAGGLLAGLGYALINAALPHNLWTRGSALVSAMWGVATLIGPATGGLFAQFGLWRWAFGVMATMAGLMTLLVLVVLSNGVAVGGEKPVAPAHKVPVWSLLLMGAAALAVSVAEIPQYLVATAGLLVAGALLVGIFVIVDWRMHVAVLPHSVFGSGPLKWIYLTMSVQMVAAMVTTYVPLFGQGLGHLTPVAAGLLGAALAFGWTAGEIVSASLTNSRLIGYIIAVAPLVMASGLALGAVTQRADASLPTVALWALALLITGAGIGIAWPHLTVRAMDCVDDPAESSSAAAAINIVQLVSAAFGAGLAGVVVNTATGGEVAAARWLYTVFTVLAAVGFIASYQATHHDRRSPG